jgi:hypothetical protein
MSRTRFFFFGGGSTVPGFGGGGAGFAGGGGAGFAGAGAGTGVDGTSMTVESAFDGGASWAPMAAKLLKLDRLRSARAARTALTLPSTKDSKKAENAKRSTTTNFDGPTAAVSAVSASSAAVSPASASAAAAPAAASTPDASALRALLVSAAVVRVAALARRFGLSAGGLVRRSAWACCASRSSTHARLAMLLFCSYCSVAPLSMQLRKRTCLRLPCCTLRRLAATLRPSPKSESIN